MIIDLVHVKNFRSILDENLLVHDLTALVGANGAGKSSFLRALDLFYNPSPKLEAEDFYDRITTAELVVAVTFKHLSQDAKALFESYIQGESLTVERVFTMDGEKTVWKYHGATLQNPAFQEIRDGFAIKDKGKTAKAAYERIRANRAYSLLPPWSNLGAAQESLKQWESNHPNDCARKRDDGQFFGFKEVAQGYLGRFTRFLYVPAVRDASDDSAEGRGSVITALMDLVVRSVLANKESLIKLKNETQKQYQEIMSPSNLGELNILATQMARTLQTFIPDANVDLKWLQLTEVDIPLPQAEVKLIEDGYACAVARTGHGLQRAFIITLLQHLALAQSSSSYPTVDETAQDQSHQETKLPDLVLAIEEPELYQHPSRQRHLAKILLQLAMGKVPGVAEKTQIIYATHSPLFVGIDRIDQIRLLRKSSNGVDKPKITKIVRTSLDDVANSLWKAEGEPGQKFSGATLLPRLQAIMTPWMNEGFFADAVILVEGEDDRAALLGVAKAMGHDLESSGFAVIPCGGKTSLDRPAVIFRQLGIPVYTIWDSDKGDDNSNSADNHRLLRLLGLEITDWPAYVQNNSACFEVRLEETLCQEIGIQEFEQYLKDCQNTFCIPKRKHAIKNPTVIATIIQKAQEQGRGSNTLMEIVRKIVALKNNKNTQPLP